MEEDSDYKNGFPKIEVNRDSVLKMLSKVAAFKMEERDLALDRFKRCNEDMEDEQFWIQGKTAIAFLDSAAKSSNYLGDMAKDVMKYVLKDDAPADGSTDSSGGISDGDKANLQLIASDFIKSKRRQEQKRQGDTYSTPEDNSEEGEE